MLKKVVNPDIREQMTKTGIGYAQMADAIGVSESTLYRWLRHELTQEQRQSIETALVQLGVA